MRLKAKLIITSFLLIITTFTLIGCNNNETYLARFIDWDDTLIEEVTVNSSAFEDIQNLPDDPVREGYTFDKWISSFDSISKVIIAKATYQINTYTIVWKNHDGSVLATDSNIEWGSTPSYGGTTPTKAATAEFNYTFIGWSPTVEVATSNQEYVAQFSETIKTYTVIWKNHDGAVLEIDNNVEYGATPSYDGKTPTKPSDSQYSYSFNGWSPEVSSVEANKTYTAQFTQSGRLCTVYFNLNGGSSPSYSSSKQISAIEKENFFFNVEKVGYNFRGWAYKGTKVFDEYGNIVGNVQLVSGMTFDALFVDKVKLTIVKNIEEAGNVIGSGEYAFNSEVDIKVIPNDGYEFIGWYYNEDVLSNQTTYKYKMWDKDLIIEARFQVASYKLQIDSNNSDKGIVAIDPSGIFSALEYSASTNKSIKWKQSVKIAAYSKTEQTRFLGWYDDEGNLVSTNAVYEFEMPYSDINYHAKWNCFSISYTMNGGTNNKSNPTIYDVDSGNIELLTPTKSGATFVAWYCDGKIITSIDTSKKSNITVEAVWSNTYYTVKYSLDGGKSYTTVNYSPADGYTLTNPTKTGYTFTGWTGSNGTTPQKNIVIKSKEIGNRTYVANWQISTYSITYSLNGGNLSNKVTSYTVEDQNIQLATPTRDYYNFSKWQIDGKDVTYISTSLAKNVTVVALWTPIDYTITYNLDGGTASNATKYNVETSTFTLTNPTRTGYKFIGWTGSNGSTPQMNVSIAKGGHTNLTYKANWEVNNYSISYVLNGGKNNANNKTTYNINSGTISLYNPTRDYYNFKEWQLNGQKVTSISSSSTLKDITLTAIWTPIGYTITYDLDGGTASNVTKYNIETSTFTLTNPKKDGYSFVGWIMNTSDNPIIDYTIEKGSHGDLYLTAVWNINKYNVVFNLNGGKGISSQKLNYNESLETFIPQYDEKTFVGWYDESLTNQYYKVPASDISVYAKWIDYEISLTCIKRTEISVNDTIDAETFSATAVDTDGNPVVVTAQIIGGTKVAGNKITVRLVAMGLYDIYATETISDINIYGAPTLTYNTEKDYINMSDTINASLFNATAVDTLENALTVNVSVKEGKYKAGDLVTIVISATDKTGNETKVEIENVKVYETPVITRNTEVVDIKASDTICNTLFGVSAVDSFGVALDVTTIKYSGTFAGGNTITIKSSTTDSKGNTNYITYSVKVYGLPTIGGATTTSFKVIDDITLDALGIVAKDSFNNTLENVTLELTSGTQIAGATLTYLVTATDHLGNVNTKEIAGIKIYGTPTITFDTEKTSMKVTDTINSNLFTATAKDSFNANLEVNVTLNSGTFAGGNIVLFKLTTIDSVGNAYEVISQGIKVYSSDDISLNYIISASNIKKTSKGEEFKATATNSFGEICDTSIEPAEGYVIAGGNTINLYIVAIDALGNTTKSNLITGIKVFDIPTIKYYYDINWIGKNENPYSLFAVIDSFGNELLYNLNIVEGSLENDETIIYEVTASDKTKNELRENVQLKVFDENEIAVKLYDNNTGEFEYVLIQLNCYTKLPLKTRDHYSFVGWAYCGELITNSQGECNIQAMTSDWYEFNAVYEPIEYNITYITNGGKLPVSYKSKYNVSDNLTNLPIPELEDAVFVSWYLDKDFKEIVDCENNKYYGDISLFAKYTSLIFQIDSDTIVGLTNEGKGRNIIEIPEKFNGIDITSITYYACGDAPYLEKIVIPTTIVEIKNCAFVSKYGENKSTTLTIYCKHEAKPNNFSDNWNYYTYDIGYPVVWNYSGEEVNYSFETNGGNFIDSIKTDALLTLPLPIKNGYNFVGWYLDENLINELTSAPFASQIDVILYAKWTTDEYEFDNRISIWENAQIVTMGNYTIHLNQGLQKLSFTPTSNGKYCIYTTGSCASYIHVLDESQHEIGYAKENYVSGYDSSMKNSKITISLEANKTYYILIGSNHTVSSSTDRNAYSNTLFIESA